MPEALQGQHKRVLAVLFLGVFMAALDVAIVGPALPSIGQAFAADPRSLSWVFAIYVLFSLVGTPFTARLSDLHGRRPLYAASVGVFAAGSLAVAMAPSFPLLLAGRAVQGFGAGGIFPVATAVIGDLFPPDRRGRALGILGMVFGLAFLAGPILGGILLRYGWPWLFLINLPVAAAVIAQGLRLLPAGRRGDGARLDVPGAVLLGAGLAMLALGVNALDARSAAAGLSSGRVWLLLAGAAAALALFWRVEQDAATPLIDLAVLRHRQLRAANLLSFIAGAVEAALVFVPSLIVAAFIVDPATASFLMVPAVLAASAGAPVAGHLLDRYGARAVVTAGSLILGTGLVLLRWLTGALPAFVADGVVIGLGLASLIGAPLSYVVLDAAAAEYRAAAQAVATLFRSVGRLVGSALLGALIASHGADVSAYLLAFTAVAAAVFAGTFLALGIRGRRRGREALP